MGCGGSVAKSYVAIAEPATPVEHNSLGRSRSSAVQGQAKRSQSEPLEGKPSQGDSLYNPQLARDPAHWASYGNKGCSEPPPLPVFPILQETSAQKAAARPRSGSANPGTGATRTVRTSRANCEEQIDSHAVPDGVARCQLQSFVRMEVLDETPMSLVLRLKSRQGNRSVAGKRVRKGSAVHEDGGHLNEVRMLHKLAGAPGIVGLIGVCDCTTEFWTLLELCGGGRLEAWLQHSPGAAGDVARQLLEAVQHLHSHLICHLDIKPDNVLLTAQGHIRLCDFVTSLQLSAPEQKITGMCGTDGFRAPEVAAGGDGYCGLSADVFSLGKTLQVVSKVDPTWRELTRVCRDMINVDAERRPRVQMVRCALFGGTPPGFCSSVGGKDGGTIAEREAEQAEHVLDFDFSSLERVASRDVGPNVQAAGSTQAAPRFTHRPPDWRKQGLGGGAGSTTAGNTGLPLGAGGLGKSRPAAQPRAGAEVAAGPLRCGRPTCTRIGACLCDDRPPEPSSRSAVPGQRVGAKKGLRRCNTP